MFKFDFDVERGEDEQLGQSSTVTNPQSVEDDQEANSPPFVTSSVEQLGRIFSDYVLGFLLTYSIQIAELPPQISYSPLRIPLEGNRSITLLRRDLFDARFQLISESLTAEASKDLDFIDAPSDLVPGVYEGGLKTWECSSDLAAYLDQVNALTPVHPCRIIEIGCGTAVPSLFLLRKLFFSDPTFDRNATSFRLTLHLQDYNSTVIQLFIGDIAEHHSCVVYVNIKTDIPHNRPPDYYILTRRIDTSQVASPASTSYRASQSTPLPAADCSEPGVLPLTPELLSAFLESLRERRIDLTFFGGSWADLEARIHQAQVTYDLVLTSETIYHSASFPRLISLLRSACKTRVTGGNNTALLPHGQAQLSLGAPFQQPESPSCLVAAKVMYFGVGGGIDDFEHAVKDAGGDVRTVMEKKAGVGRRIIKVDWS